VGVAAAGILGFGSAVSTGVANADSTNVSDSASASTSAESSDSPGASPRAHTRGQANPAANSPGAKNPQSSTPRAPRRTPPKQLPQPTAAAADTSVTAKLPTTPTAEANSATSELASSQTAAATTSVDTPSPTSTQSESVPVVDISAKVAPSPARVPNLPIPLLPVAPASAVASGFWTATGRSRTSVVPFAAATTQNDELVTALADTPAQHVLVIGIDGTNLSAILGDDFNQNLFALMNTGTTAASTIVGHTTISNPSWTGILTGVWSETAGVINNVFTPWTYDKWPTVFNQLETYLPSVQTTAIANWANIAQIAGAGSAPADVIKYFAPVNNDFISSDNQVGAASVEAIQNTQAGTHSFQFTYFVGVDDTGHEFDAGSPQYANALRNVDQNIGSIMAEIALWELANPGEEWTVIVTTDHGQVPWPTIKIGSEQRAHGFQTPWETTTFVIANGPGFAEGAINNTYKNIDVTPTVVSLFGLSPEPYSQGSPLMDLAGNDYRPIVPGIEAIKQALTDAINMYGYPDIATNVSLMIRTIAATIPYAIFTVFDGLSQSVPEFLQLPVQFIGAVIYQMFNIPAQIIARMTGVTGNQIIPPDLWPYEPIPGTQPTTPEPAATLLTMPSCASNDQSACLAS
jgi:hypothetical protein